MENTPTSEKMYQASCYTVYSPDGKTVVACNWTMSTPLGRAVATQLLDNHYQE